MRSALPVTPIAVTSPEAVSSSSGPPTPLAVMSPEEERTTTAVLTGTCSTISARHGPKLNLGQLPLSSRCAPSLIARTRGECTAPSVLVSTRTLPSGEGRTWISPGPASTVSFSTGPEMTWRFVRSTAPIVQPATWNAAQIVNTAASRAPASSASTAVTASGHR